MTDSSEKRQVTSNPKLQPPGEPHRKTDDPDVWILPGRGEYSVGDAFLHYRLMWETYVASLTHETSGPPLSAIELAQQLGSWFDLKIPLIEREQKVAQLVVTWANQRNTPKASEPLRVTYHQPGCESLAGEIGAKCKPCTCGAE